MPVLFEGGDPEFEPEKPDESEALIKRGRKLIRVGLLMLVLGLLVCLFFVVLVVGVVPASIAVVNQAESVASLVPICLFFFVSYAVLGSLVEVHVTAP